MVRLFSQQPLIVDERCHDPDVLAIRAFRSRVERVAELQLESSLETANTLVISLDRDSSFGNTGHTVTPALISP